MESYNCSTNITYTAEWPDGPLEADEHFLRGTRFLIQRVLVPVVVVVGLVGNAATIVVLTRRRMRSSTNVYLTALAASDLLYLTAIFLLSLRHYPGIGSMDTSYFFYWRLHRFVLWLADSMTATSIWLTVAFTVERYIAVCHPMRGRLLCTEYRARLAVLVVWSFCVFATASVPWESYVVWHRDHAGRECVRECESWLGANEVYISIYSWFSALLFMALPLLMLAVFNCFLINAVRQSRRARRSMTQNEPNSVSQHQRQENRITITLIGVVILFLVCQTPSAALLVYKSFVDETKVHRSLGNICNFLVAVNAASNFLLYCALSDKYRRTFLVTFVPWCYKAQSTALQRTGSMYSTHSDFTRTTRSRVGSVYLQVPKDRSNGAGGNRLQRTASGYSSQSVGGVLGGANRNQKDRPSPNRLAPPSAANGNGFDGHD
ncbi:FMRFamide Receptor [Frankliniella occidentalis]|uniref:FMRFamide receptor-like n=1 Tax=Frankliniella occidentalis TaxID=133901 RepID=A0A9C6X3V1_FRAOC|nr:FMRFamide receptor-like [Frankliniella occidentalis]XP_052128644.1 FMRFamide receptor-like [Frankliniella occidentalis]KAE8741276.1 FMRFamide Receptor [Frankliniella occidentalis]